jgi:Dolichyl-phosphate-mannose-protein mannosyltransferase
LVAYAVILLIAILSTPLWLAEILQVAASAQASIAALVSWMVITPGAAPIFFFTQFPFVALLGHSPLVARLPTLIFALASCYVFWRIARSIALQQPLLATCLFVLVPIHYRFATTGIASEEALFFLLLATLFFVRLVETAAIRDAVLYTVFLTLCLYTEPFSYLPAAGYLLGLLVFVNRKEVRRTIWISLPATATPILLFFPFAFWAHPFTAKAWLYESGRFAFGPSVYLTAFRELSATGWAGYFLSSLLLAGALVGGWRAIKLPEPMMLKRVRFICLLGGVVSTIALALIIDGTSNGFFSADQIFWALPGLVLLVSATLDWLSSTRKLPIIASALAALLLVICIGGDVENFTHRPYDIGKAANLIPAQLTGDSCVVFVSESLSKAIFTVFDRQLEDRECANFFHKRIVLASHPFVRPDQQEDAESFFRGLNFTVKKRIEANGSKIIVLEQH